VKSPDRTGDFTRFELASAVLLYFCIQRLNWAEKHRPALTLLLVDKTKEGDDHCLKSRPVEYGLVW